MKYGVDVGKVRTDDWDKRLLAEVAARVARGQYVSVLEVGCGVGAQAVRLAEAGAEVMAIDIVDYGVEVTDRAKKANVPNLVKWQRCDVRDYVTTTSPADAFSFVSMQRVLHYLSYSDAKELLLNLKKITDTALYLSVTGITTAIADYYNAKNLPLAERWGTLNTAGQQLFSITEPLCLYSEAEILELLEDTGWQIEKIRTSDFGNVKVVTNKVV